VRGQKITTDRVRLRITQSPACPAISEVGLFIDKSGDDVKLTSDH
jgi:hypothetical protein